MLGKKRSKVRTTGTIHTLISHGTAVEGKLQCPYNLRIDGQFSGEIECQGTVIIGELGEVQSNITALQVIVAGKVLGEITCHGKLLITASGVVLGNCEAEYLVIHEGAILNGVSSVLRQEESGKGNTRTNTNAKESEKQAHRKGKRDEKQSDKLNEKQAG